MGRGRMTTRKNNSTSAIARMNAVLDDDSQSENEDNQELLDDNEQDPNDHNSESDPTQPDPNDNELTDTREQPNSNELNDREGSEVDGSQPIAGSAEQGNDSNNPANGETALVVYNQDTDEPLRTHIKQTLLQTVYGEFGDHSKQVMIDGVQCYSYVNNDPDKDDDDSDEYSPYFENNDDEWDPSDCCEIETSYEANMIVNSQNLFGISLQKEGGCVRTLIHGKHNGTQFACNEPLNKTGMNMLSILADVRSDRAHEEKKSRKQVDLLTNVVTKYGIHLQSEYEFVRFDQEPTDRFERANSTWAQGFVKSTNFNPWILRIKYRYAHVRLGKDGYRRKMDEHAALWDACLSLYKELQDQQLSESDMLTAGSVLILYVCTADSLESLDHIPILRQKSYADTKNTHPLIWDANNKEESKDHIQDYPVTDHAGQARTAKLMIKEEYIIEKRPEMIIRLQHIIDEYERLEHHTIPEARWITGEGNTDPYRLPPPKKQTDAIVPVPNESPTTKRARKNKDTRASKRGRQSSGG